MSNFSLNRVDLSLLIPSVILVLISLATFYSIDINIFKQQLIYLILSLFVYFLFLNIDYKIFGLLSKYVYVFILSCLLIVFIVGIEAKGATRWVEVFGISLQFSEVIKPFFIIVVAYFLSKTESVSLEKFIKSLILLFPVFFLTLKQPDLGNALIYFVAVVFMLFMYGFPFSYFVGCAIMLLIPMPLLFNLMHDYQKQRILSFFNSSQDPFGSSYNSIQSLISIGSGGWQGKGFGEATQSILKFLPERHTDFIFATISESLGFVGGIVILFLFALLLYRIYLISLNVHDKFSYLIVVGFYFITLTHIFLNIGMNIGVLPIVGITLPFVSYGGSSLLTNFIMLGIISSIGSEFKRKYSFEIK